MKQKKLKKPIVITSIILVLVLGLVFCVWYLTPEPTINKMGEALVLNSEEELSFKEKTLNYYPGLGFDGTMEVKVEKAELFPSYTAAGILEKDIVIEIPETAELPFLVLHCNIINKNAEAAEGGDFNISLLSLSTKKAFEGYNAVSGLAALKEEPLFSQYINYFSLHAVQGSKNSPVNIYYHYNIKKGETIEFQLGFFVNKVEFENGSYILKAGSSNMNKCGIALAEGTND